MTPLPQRSLPPWLLGFDARLATHTLGQTLVYLPRTPSTNTAAADLARHQAPDGTLVVTDDQHAGRGRQGRSWLAAPGQNLTFSLILHPKQRLTEWPFVGFAAAVALARVIEAYAPAMAVQVKWPNDVLVDGRKVAGLLLETVQQSPAHSALVVGIGLNVNQTVFDEELNRRATSLACIAGGEQNRAVVLADVLYQFESLLPLCDGDGQAILLHLYTARLAGLGGPVVFRETHSSKPVEGRLVGLTPAGTLQIDTADGIRSFRAGDLTTHLP